LRLQISSEFRYRKHFVENILELELELRIVELFYCFIVELWTLYP